VSDRNQLPDDVREYSDLFIRFPLFLMLLEILSLLPLSLSLSLSLSLYFFSLHPLFLLSSRSALKLTLRRGLCASSRARCSDRPGFTWLQLDC